MKNDLISVIVPVYKAEAFLYDCIRSIRAQTYRNLEIILVNDGSPDRCGDLCDAFAKVDNRIKVIHKENGGVASARNAGLDAAQGEFITFADSDDTIDADMYERMYKRLTETNADMSVCGLKMIYDNYKRIVKVPYEKKVTSSQLWASYITDLRNQLVILTAVWNKLIRKSMLKSTKTGMEIRFPEDFRNAEDGVFIADCIELAENGIVFIDFNPYNYAQTKNSGSLTKADSYDNICKMMEHLKAVMKRALPDSVDEVEKIINLQIHVNKVIVMHVAITGKQKPPFKLSWYTVKTILRKSKNHQERFSAFLMYCLPIPLYRVTYMLYCKIMFDE